ncbi:MAG: MBOAT family O-acyltransferase [Oscillospiraceae bacterium]
MAFISVKFVLFMTIVAALYYILPRRWSNTLLVAASGMFYYISSPRSLPWLALSVIISYTAAIICERVRGTRSKTAVVALALVLDIGALVFFKYSGFFMQHLESMLGFPVAAEGAFGIIVPFGISFYTLQTVGYLIDVRRGTIAAERNVITYAAYITFFPHIMSGPIARASHLLPQFNSAAAFSWENICGGVRRFLWGLFKKAVIADTLALFVDTVYTSPANENPLTVLAACLAFGLQLYFDFSAYTDMALGAGLLLGFQLDENFSAPYFSTSVTEIWTRWHLSLTSWLHEYVYFPLGGSRKGYTRKLINIMLVFIVSGLWHGGHWGFVVWGILFGILRIFEDVVGKKLSALPPLKGPARKAVLIVRTAYSYLAWCGVFIFFRMKTITASVGVISRIFTLSQWSVSAFEARCYNLLLNTIPSSPAFAKLGLLIIAMSTLLALALEYYYVYLRHAHTDRPNDLLAQLPEWPRFAVYMFMLCASLAFGMFGSSSFVYFQF